MNFNECYETTNGTSPGVLFWLSETESECWSMSQFLRCRLEPNPAATNTKGEPPEMLTAFFAMGRVILLGKGLDRIAQKLCSNELTKVEVDSTKETGKKVTVASIQFELDEPAA